MPFIHKTKKVSDINLTKNAENGLKNLRSLAEISNELKSIRYLGNNFFEYEKPGRNNFKLLLYKYEKNEQPIYLLCEYVTDFASGWHKIRKKVDNQEYNIEASDVNAAVRAFKENQSKPKKNVDAELANWINNDLQPDISVDIYETKDWIDFFKDVQDDYASSIYTLLKKIADNDLSPAAIEYITSDNRNIRRAFTDNKAIDLLYVVYEIFYDNGTQKILLHTGGKKKATKEYDDKIKKVTQNYKNNSKSELSEYLKTIAFRAYPKTIAFNSFEFWKNNIEGSKDDNLSLIPEQEVFFNDYFAPTFIYGQAGSGKSTILYYLFANFLWKYKLGYPKNNSETHQPLFLTENENLLKKSKQLIKGILENREGFKKEDFPDYEKYFYTFKDFLQKELAEFVDEKQLSGKYIDYDEFKNLYRNFKLRPKKHNAELLWYVISNLIKGYRLDIFTPEDYKKLDEKDIQELKLKVSYDTFKDIYENEYKRWYKHITNPDDNRHEGWDKYDLVREVLSQYKTLPKQFSFIFCDEAQDFTNIEIELIASLSELTSFDIADNIDQLPIVLAGDPLQTVNPSGGFRLEKINEIVKQGIKKRIEFTKWQKNIVRELEVNHRSKERIVNLANIVQFYRANELKSISLEKSQKSKYKPDKLFTPIYFERDEPNLKQKIKHSAIIVPERGYDTDRLTEIENIQTSSEAKGLEYPKVILYGFGEYFLQQINDLKNSEEISFKQAYFFNKLYVGITRAQKHLIIIDTQRAIESFWENKIIQKVKEKYSKEKYTNWDIDTDTPIKKGNITALQDLDKERIKELETNAAIDRKYANEMFDVERMERAAAQFRLLAPEKLQYRKEEIECRAEAHIIKAKTQKIKEEWTKAGNIYNENPDYQKEFNDKIKNCYWIAGAWPKILEKETSEFRKSIARFMSEKDINFIFQFPDFIKKLNADENQKYIYWNTNFYDQFITKLKIASLKKQQAIEIADIIWETDEFSNSDALNLIADLYYYGNEDKKALEVWEKLDLDKNKSKIKYWNTKIKYAQNPNDKIEFLQELYETTKDSKVRQRLVDYYESAEPDIKKYQAVVETIFNHYITFEQYTDALKINNLSNRKAERNWSVLVGSELTKNAKFTTELVNYVVSEVAYEVLNIQLFEHLINLFNSNDTLKSNIAEDINLNEIKDETDKNLIINTFRLVAYSDLQLEELQKIDSNKILRKVVNKVAVLVKEEKNHNIDYYELAGALERVEEINVNILWVYEEILKSHTIDIATHKFLEKRWLRVKSRKEKYFTPREEYDTDSLVYEEDKIETNVFEEYESRFEKEGIKYHFSQSEIENIPLYPQIRRRTPIRSIRQLTETEKILQTIHSDLFLHLVKKHNKEENFFFKLRPSEQKTKLENGFWFPGEDYVSVSFWDGIQQGKPIIQFIVWADKSSSLQFNAGNSNELIDFFEYITVLAFDDFKRKKDKGEELPEWQLDYTGTNFLKNLDDFIENKKTKIDDLLQKKLNSKRQSIDNLAFIEKKEFREGLEHIFKIRKQSFIQPETTTTSGAEKYLKIDSIRLHNIGRFKEPIEIQFDEKVTCIVGENGFGKTTILSAIVLALIGINENRIVSQYQNELEKMLRIEKTEDIEVRSKTGSIEIEYTIGQDKYKNQIEFTVDEQGKVDIEDVSTSDFKASFGANNLFLSNLVLGFPQGGGKREIKDEDIEGLLNKVKRPNISDIFPLIFFAEDNRIESFKKWLFSIYVDCKNGDEKAKEIIDIVFEMISEITSSKVALKLIDKQRNGKEKIVLQTDENPEGISSEMLSQGLSNVFNWIGYFIQRLYETNPEIKDVKKARGILIIDEIDIYLHPKWQVKLLKVLKKHFPNVQFIISTHSPLILHGLDRNQVCKLSLSENNAIIAERNPVDIWNWSYLEILEEMYNQNDPEPVETEEELRLLIKEAKQAGDTKKVKSLEENLERLRESQQYKDDIEKLKQSLKEQEHELFDLMKEYKEKLAKLD